MTEKGKESEGMYSEGSGPRGSLSYCTAKLGSPGDSQTTSSRSGTQGGVIFELETLKMTSL